MNGEMPQFTRRPKNSPFYQQKLAAWQPMFTARKSAITFLVMGGLFVPLGAVLLVASNAVVEYIVDYTDCKNIKSGISCSEVAFNCVCSLPLDVLSEIPKPVYLYYQLEHFYQNHRRYVRSKSDAQLLGAKQLPDSLTSCSPYSTLTNTNGTFAILPCGAVANSIFNDTVELTYQPDLFAAPVSVQMTKQGIAWKSDVDRKFGTLSTEALKDTVKPPNWPLPIEIRSPGAFKTDEELMVWMRVAALPNFRKLHRRIIHSNLTKQGLPAGKYVFRINYNFPVSSFGGRKAFVLANVSWLGGKNITLGVTCIVTGVLHLLLGGAFLLVFIFSNRRFPFSQELHLASNGKPTRSNESSVSRMPLVSFE